MQHDGLHAAAVLVSLKAVPTWSWTDAQSKELMELVETHAQPGKKTPWRKIAKELTSRDATPTACRKRFEHLCPGHGATYRAASVAWTREQEAKLAEIVAQHQRTYGKVEWEIAADQMAECRPGATKGMCYKKWSDIAWRHDAAARGPYPSTRPPVNPNGVWAALDRQNANASTQGSDRAQRVGALLEHLGVDATDETREWAEMMLFRACWDVDAAQRKMASLAQLVPALAGAALSRFQICQLLADSDGDASRVLRRQADAAREV